MATVRIPESHFIKNARRQCSDADTTLVREALQNSLGVCARGRWPNTPERFIGKAGRHIAWFTMLHSHCDIARDFSGEAVTALAMAAVWSS